MVVLNARPELAQFLDPLAGFAASNQRRVDRADRSADHPVGSDSGLVKRFIDADLIGAERPSALEDEHRLAESRDFAFERLLHAHFLSSGRASLGCGKAGISPVIS